MSITNDLPTVLIKRKNIQAIFDYCLDNKVEFTVREKPFTIEEFEVILQITEIKKAIAFGIFARENKIEIAGVNDQPATAKPAAKRTATKVAEPEPKKEEPVNTLQESKEEIEAEEPEAAESSSNKGFSLDFSSPSLSLS